MIKWLSRYYKKLIKANELGSFARHFYLGIDMLSWIAKDLLRQFPLRVIAVTAFNVIAVASGALVLSSIILYGRQLASRGVIEIRGIALPEANGVNGIWVALVICILGLTSSTCIYLSEWAVVKLTVAYQRECERRLFQVITDPNCRGWGSLFSEPAMSGLMKLRPKSKILAISARRLVRMILPLLTSIVATLTLVLMNYWLTTLLLPLFALYLIPLYIINRGATNTQRNYEIIIPKVKSKIKRAIRKATKSHNSLNLRYTGFDQVIDDPSYYHSGILFFKRRLLPEKTKLLNNVFLIVGIFILFIYAAFNADHPNWSWTEFVLYLILLRVTVSSLQGITSTLIMLSRFLPHIFSYVQFVRDASALRIKRLENCRLTKPLHNMLTLSLERGELPNSLQRVEMTIPKLIWVLYPYQPQSIDLESIAVMLEQRASNKVDLINNARFYSFTQDKQQELFERIRSLDEESRKDFLLSLQRLGVRKQLDTLLQKIFDGYNPNLKTIDMEACWSLSLAETLNEGNPLFIHSASFQQLRISFIDQLTSILNDRLIVLVTSDPEEVIVSSLSQRSQDPPTILVLNKGKVIGCGGFSWLKTHKTSIINIFKTENSQHNAQNQSFDFEDDSI